MSIYLGIPKAPGAVACWALITALCATEPTLTPAFLRLDLNPQDIRQISFDLIAPPGDTVTAIMADCACIRIGLAVPVVVPVAGRLPIPLRVTGVRPGVESITVHTTRGRASVQVQIVGPGAGQGRQVLAAAVAQAQQQHLALWGIVHDLRGQVRNCGCSHGSLGGAGILAALPAAVAAQAPDLKTTWVLTGDSDGKRPGVGAALAESGWRLADPAVVVAADPEPFLAVAGVVAVITPGGSAIHHRRVVEPALPQGMAVQLLLVTEDGQVREQRVLPVDPSLPVLPGFAERFPERLTWDIRAQVSPSQACATCHPEAMSAWSASGHAQAFARLPAADQHDGCVGCHVTPLAERIAAPGVHCQSCHQGAVAHAQQPTLVKTQGLSDCRACHDVPHHPTFDPAAAWSSIRHGLQGYQRNEP